MCMCCLLWFFFFKQKTAYGRRISDWSSDVCSSDLTADKAMGRGYARNARIASFVGAFPMDDPRYVVFAMVDEPKPTKETYGYATGGWVAAPLAGRVIERIAPLLGIQPREDDAAMIQEMIADIEMRAEGRQLASN